MASRATARRLFGAGAPPPPADPPAAPAGDWEEDAHARCFPRNPFRRTATASSSAAVTRRAAARIWAGDLPRGMIIAEFKLDHDGLTAIVQHRLRKHIAVMLCVAKHALFS